MNSAPDNPPENRLTHGVSEENIAEAVSKSGYPLQTVVAAHLRSAFNPVHEEWSYIDSDTGQFRTMDVFARKHVDVNRLPTEDEQVMASLCLLIECKKSDLPYIFFLSPDTMPSPDFPLMCGLPELTLELSSNIYREGVPISHALNLESLPFISESLYCTSFSRLERPSKNKMHLSGDDPFNRLVQPIAKAMRHHEAHRISGPYDYASYLCDITLGVGVLDAPMVGVHVSENDNSLSYVPWVRVVRHESSIPEDADRKLHRLLAIDIVHRGFFQTYLEDHVYAFAADVAGCLKTHENALANGKGRANDDWTLRNYWTSS